MQFTADLKKKKKKKKYLIKKKKKFLYNYFCKVIIRFGFCMTAIALNH